MEPCPPTWAPGPYYQSGWEHGIDTAPSCCDCWSCGCGCHARPPGRQEQEWPPFWQPVGRPYAHPVYVQGGPPWGAWDEDAEGGNSQAEYRQTHTGHLHPHAGYAVPDEPAIPDSPGYPDPLESDIYAPEVRYEDEPWPVEGGYGQDQAGADAALEHPGYRPGHADYLEETVGDKEDAAEGGDLAVVKELEIFSIHSGGGAHGGCVHAVDFDDGELMEYGWQMSHEWKQRFADTQKKRRQRRRQGWQKLEQHAQDTKDRPGAQDAHDPKDRPRARLSGASNECARSSGDEASQGSAATQAVEGATACLNREMAKAKRGVAERPGRGPQVGLTAAHGSADSPGHRVMNVGGRSKGVGGRDLTQKEEFELSAQRKKALYGEQGASRIAALEASLNAEFDALCDRTHAAFWPCLPLRLHY